MGIPIFIHLSKKINILFIYIWGLESAPEAPGKTLEDIVKGLGGAEKPYNMLIEG